MRFLSLLVAATVFLYSCKKDDTGPQYNFEAPASFPAKVYNEPFDAQKFELGRKLFYDPILSENNTISCGSCHQQFAAFAHLDHKTSHGIHGLLGTRNAPGMFNMAWQPNFMWDGGVNHIETLPLAPITNPVEMDLSMAEVLARLNANATYKALFKDAFGADVITDYHLFKSFAQFMAAMVSGQSRYDEYMGGKKDALTADEVDGLNLFTAKCASCHTPPLFTNFQFVNNGLDAEFTTETGRHHITQLEEDKGKFRVPSLRNVALTRPYMHDGRIKNLYNVLDHYSGEIKQSPTLDTRLESGIPLTEVEKNKLVKFLGALTDDAFIKNPAFAEPK